MLCNICVYNNYILIMYIYIYIYIYIIIYNNMHIIYLRIINGNDNYM